MHYKVLEAVALDGNDYEVGHVIEMDEAEAETYVAAGQLTEATPEEIEAAKADTTPEAAEATPATETSAEETAAPAAEASAEQPAEEKKGWIGGHDVMANERGK